jgi:hypothetical protein
MRGGIQGTMADGHHRHRNVLGSVAFLVRSKASSNTSTSGADHFFTLGADHFFRLLFFAVRLGIVFFAFRFLAMWLPPLTFVVLVAADAS